MFRIFRKKKMEHDSLVYWCALNLIFADRCSAGISLVERFPDPEEIFSLSRRKLMDIMPGGERYVQLILDGETVSRAAEEVKWARRYDIRIETFISDGYPSRLRECPDAPLVLYCKGDVNLNAARVISIVGTRRASFYGKSAVEKIVESLSKEDVKPLIVSGLALGIDGAAHRAALEMGLDTVAVLPTGLDEIYPPRHRELATRILEKGGLVTDFPRNTLPARYTFLKRNRIIAGMSDAVLLAQSYAKGGGLITASLAVQYDRELFAVPGNMDDPSFEGCNNLIYKNKAVIMNNPRAIADALGWKRAEVREPGLFDASVSERGSVILSLLKSEGPMAAEDIAACSGMAPGTLSSELLALELSGRIFNDRHFYYLCR